MSDATSERDTECSVRQCLQEWAFEVVLNESLLEPNEPVPIIHTLLWRVEMRSHVG